MRKGLSVLLLVVFLGSCSMSMPETQVYSLNLPNWENSRESSSDASLAVLISSPRYLTQPYIAYRSSPYQLSVSRYSKWEAAPDEMVRQAFGDKLSSSGFFRYVRTSNVVPNGFYYLKINLRQFERSDEGNASFGELAFNADLFSPEGKEIYHTAVTKKVRLEDRSFLSLAKALSKGLSEGVAEVKANMEKSLTH
jgi:uncharacterized lipoprotein YmbA